MSRRNAFANEKAYTMHIQQSPSCFNFICREMKQQHAMTAQRFPQQHSSDNTAGDGQSIITSMKHASSLRCNVVNSNMHLPLPSFSSLPVLPTSASTFDHNNSNEDSNASDNDTTGSLLGDHFDNSDSNTLPASHKNPGDANDGENHSKRLKAFASQFMYTRDQKWTIALLKILDDMNAPDYAFSDVIKWAQAASSDDYSFCPDGGCSRLRNIDILFQSVHNAKRLLPSVVTVPMPHGPSCDVITFEFVPQLLNLLQDVTLMTSENLLIDLDNPLVPYSSPDGILGDAISGSVYRDAYKRMITNPHRQLFVPIIQWIDRTSVTGNDRFSLKPYMFTPAIFKETFRRTIKAWGYHGFLPKPKTSSAQNQTKKQGDNIRNYHAQLYAVLHSFTTAGPQLENVLLPIGPAGSLRVDIITCILFVIQDMQEGDQLCGRYGPHSPDIHRHCRACNVSYANLDNPDVKCVPLLAHEMSKIAHDTDLAVRKRWSQHFLNNAFDHVPMADPVRGIFGSTPVETMHAFRKGMIEVVTFLVINNVPVSKKAALDSMAVSFHQTHRQTIRKAYPATDFSNGITNLTKISAAERVGLVFLFVILSQYDEGWDILNHTLQLRKGVQLDKIINVFEAMLCFDQWLNQPTYWTAKDHQASTIAVRKSIKALMRMCRNDLPLSNNKKNKLSNNKTHQTWKFPKFHELLHILDDMERFGASINYCAQRPESLLIPVAKQPGRRAQKRHVGSAYELQSAQRLSYSLMINTLYTRIWDPTANEQNADIDNNDNDHVKEGTGNATFATVTCTNQNHYEICWNTSTDISLMTVPNALLHFLCQTFGSGVCFCTEYVRDVFTFRCHPAYQSGGPIFDWMDVEFEDDSNNTHVYPCRLAAVVVGNNPANSDEPYQLVVQCGSKETGTKSVLFTEWTMSDQYWVISPSSIVGPCFVISIKDDSSKILQTLPLHKWPSQFTKPVNEHD